MTMEAMYNSMMKGCSEDELKEHKKLMSLSRSEKIKKAHEILDELEYQLTWAFSSTK